MKEHRLRWNNTLPKCWTLLTNLYVLQKGSITEVIKTINVAGAVLAYEGDSHLFYCTAAGTPYLSLRNRDTTYLTVTYGGTYVIYDLRSGTGYTATYKTNDTISLEDAHIVAIRLDDTNS